MALNYGRRWKAHRAVFLRENPCCALCAARGITEPATVVDHIEPWRRAETEEEQTNLFWSRSNWQGLCTTCHSAVKQAEEKNGFLRGSDLQGWPLDQRHHWHREAKA